jgi:hypothetical protein
LQRNQRNNARQSIAARITTEISNFAGNNNGLIPSNATSNTAGAFGSLAGANSFAGRYLAGIDINDPSTGAPVVLSTSTSATVPTGSVFYNPGTVCDIDGATTGGTGRNFTIRMGLEGGNLVYCLDNQ